MGLLTTGAGRLGSRGFRKKAIAPDELQTFYSVSRKTWLSVTIESGLMRNVLLSKS